ncbi:MAG TPA: hypothetical protein VIL08_04310, partial [Limnochorda sp.]
QTLLAAAAMVILMAIPGGLVGARAGRHRTMATAGGFLVLLLLVAPVLRPGLPLIAALAGAGLLWAFIVVNAYPAVAALGHNVQTGAYTGLYYLFTVTGAVLTPPVMGALMDRFGEGFLFTGAALQALLGVILLWLSAPGAARQAVPGRPEAQA